MALVGVISKAVGPEELEMASRGITPPDLGGGPVGAKGIPRGYSYSDGGHERDSYRAASQKYHDRMAGGADVGTHNDERKEEGRSAIPHPSSDEDSSPDRLLELLGLDRGNPGGKAGLRGAMARQGDGASSWFQDGPGAQGRTMQGSPTAHIPGTKEAWPSERHHAELPMEEGMEEGEMSTAGRRVGVAGKNNLQQLRGRANSLNENAFDTADTPQGSGSRRQG